MQKGRLTKTTIIYVVCAILLILAVFIGLYTNSPSFRDFVGNNLLLSPAQSSSSPSFSDLRLYYDFQQLMSDNRIKDMSGNGNHGTSDFSTPRFIEGRVSRAYELNGYDDIIKVSNSPSLGISGAFSVSFWFKGTETQGPQYFVSKWAGTQGTISWFADIAAPGGNCPSNSAIDFYVSEDGTSTDRVYVRECAKTYQDGRWHLYTGVFNPGKSIKLYIDGQSVGTVVGNPATVNSVYQNNAEVIVGAGVYPLGDTNFFSSHYAGTIDELKIYAHALSSSEIFSLYSVPSNCNNKIDDDGDGFVDYSVDIGCFNAQDLEEYASPPSLYYDFETFQGYSNIYLADLSGNGNDGLFNIYTLPKGGRVSKTFEFDNPYMDLLALNSLSLHSSDDLAISVWVHPRNFVAQEGVVVAKTDGSIDCPVAGDNCSNREYFLSVDKDGRIKFQVTPKSRIGIGSLNCQTGIGKAPYNKWTHVVVQASAITQKMSIFVNGLEVVSCTQPTLASGIRESNGSLTVGSMVSAQNEYNSPFSGYLDELKIYRRLLSSQEISTLYNVPFNCANGKDDDDDGKVDWPSDTSCSSSGDFSESPQCSDGVDNDGDGRDDGEDAACKVPGKFTSGCSYYCPDDSLDNEGSIGKYDPKSFNSQMYYFYSKGFTDPFVFKANDGYYYSYFTTVNIYSSNQLGNFAIYKSKDMAIWSFAGNAFWGSNGLYDIPGKLKWENLAPADYHYEIMWSPKVYYRKDYRDYAMIFTAYQVPNNETNLTEAHLFENYGQTLWIAFADNPTGPFGPYNGKRMHEPVPFRNSHNLNPGEWFDRNIPHSETRPMCPQTSDYSGWPSCMMDMRADGTIFEDVNGDKWSVYTYTDHNPNQYWTHIAIVRLDPTDMTFTHKSAVGDDLMFRITDSTKDLYDYRTGKKMEMCKWQPPLPYKSCINEAPSIIYRNGKYILFYSANDWKSDSYSVYFKMANSLKCLKYGRENEPACGVKQGIAFDGTNSISSITYGSGTTVVGPDGQQMFHLLTTREKQDYATRLPYLFEQKFDADGAPSLMFPSATDEFFIRGV